MTQDLDRRTLLTELIIASGLVVIGFVTVEAPLVPLVAAAAGIGGNWATSLAQRGFQHWRNNWFTERGALNQDIAWALGKALQECLGQLEDDWKKHGHYLYLERTNSAAAALTLDLLKWLRKDTDKFFRQPSLLTSISEQKEIAILLQQDEVSARHFLDKTLDNYFYGHDEELRDFVRNRLRVDDWLLRINHILRSHGEKETRAWRAVQQLLQTSLIAAIGTVGQNTTEMLTAVQWLKEWAEKLEDLPPTKLDSTLAQRDLIELIGKLVRELEIMNRHQLAQAYAGEVRQKFEYWRQRYIALPAHSTSTLLVTQVNYTPAYFRRRGGRLTYNSQGLHKSTQKRKSVHFDDIRDAIATVGDAILLGEPGSGKTTVLWRMMLDYADQVTRDPNKQLPILVPLGGYDGKSDLLEFIRHQLAEAIININEVKNLPLPTHHLFATRLDDELRHQSLAIFFDGLNELPPDNYAMAINRIIAFHKEYQGNRFLFTCRDTDYTIPLSLPEIYVEPLDDDSIQDFIQAYLCDQNLVEQLIDQLQSETRVLWEIGRNPYMLRMIVDIYQESGLLLKNRAALFSNFVGDLLIREYFISPGRFQVNQDPLNYNIEVKLLKILSTCWPLLENWKNQATIFGSENLTPLERQGMIVQAGLIVLALAHFAYHISVAGQHGTAIPKDTVSQFLPEQLNLNGHIVIINSSQLLYLAHSASLLEQTSNEIRFAHQLLQEYFTTVYLAVQLELVKRLPKAIYEPGYWSETFVLLSGLLPHPEKLLDQFLKFNQKNWQVFLAARCIIEGNSIEDLQCLLSCIELLCEIIIAGKTEWESIVKPDSRKVLRERFEDSSFTDDEDELSDTERKTGAHTNYIALIDDEFEEDFLYFGQDEYGYEDEFEEETEDEDENQIEWLSPQDYEIWSEFGALDWDHWLTNLDTRQQSLNYIIDIGQRYPDLDTTEILSQTLFTITSDPYNVDIVWDAPEIIRGLIRELWRQNSGSDENAVIDIFLDDNIIPEAKIVMTPVLMSLGYADADSCLLDLLGEYYFGVDFVMGAIDTLIDVGNRSTVDKLVSIYEDEFELPVVRQNALAILWPLCKRLGYHFIYDKSTGHIQVEDQSRNK